MDKKRYARWTVAGDKEIRWICGCFQTTDGFFKFCKRHEGTLKKAIQAQVDELDMTRVTDYKERDDGLHHQNSH